MKNMLIVPALRFSASSQQQHYIYKCRVARYVARSRKGVHSYCHGLFINWGWAVNMITRSKHVAGSLKVAVMIIWGGFERIEGYTHLRVIAGSSF